MEKQSQYHRKYTNPNVSILYNTYNIGANGADDRAIQAFDKLQRKHLRHICGKHYSDIISNVELYNRTDNQFRLWQRSNDGVYSRE
jgi:hypothetical protein